MNKKFRTWLLLSLPLMAIVWPEVALAQDGAIGSELSFGAILATIVYGVIGVVMCILSYFAFDILIGLDIKRELMEDQNTAIGIMLAGAFVGIGLVLAAVMIS